MCAGFFSGIVRRRRVEEEEEEDEDGQLESVAKISNLQYIEVLHSYGNPIY